MKWFLLIISVLALAGCDDKPAPPPVAVQATSNGYNIATLFEKDGCTVYRFQDQGYYRYFAKCGKKAEVTTEHSENCGKGCTRRVITTTSQGEP